MSDRIGIVVCSRTDSTRLPNKPFLPVGDKFLLAHLLDRLLVTGIPVYVAVPQAEHGIYQTKLEAYPSLQIFPGDKDDPLRRIFDLVNYKGLDHVIRVCHDKIFINYKQIDSLIEYYFEHKLDYIYSTSFIPGMGFEIFSSALVREAHLKFKNVEHISYAIEAVAKKPKNMLYFPYNRNWLRRQKPNVDLRLLIDFPEDLDTIKKLVEDLGADADITQIVDSLTELPHKNPIPEITVYSCVYNDTVYLERCIRSVLSQSFRNFEYLIIDDGSDSQVTDRFKSSSQLHIVRNQANRGLASSSNVATAMARGRYVIRLDADDYFIDEKVLARMYRRMEDTTADILYPDNYTGNNVQRGDLHHHVGGAMFRKRTLDYLRFTDGLRHFDGLDLYHRAVLAKSRIDYFNEPTFYYRERAGSMSRTKSSERDEIAKKIGRGVLGEKLVDEL